MEGIDNSTLSLNFQKSGFPRSTAGSGKRGSENNCPPFTKCLMRAPWSAVRGTSFSVALLLASPCGVRWAVESVTGRHRYLMPSFSGVSFQGCLPLGSERTRSRSPWRQSTSSPLRLRRCAGFFPAAALVRLGLVPERCDVKLRGCIQDRIWRGASSASTDAR